LPPPALRAARIRAATQDPAGGRIERDAAGHPTGTLRDTAAEIALRAEPKPSLDFEVSQLDKAFDTMRAIGITSVQDANTDDHEMQLYRRLYDTHRLNMRVRASFGLKDTHRPADALIGEAIQFRAKWTIDPEFLRADAVKIFADGVVEYPSQTAALLEPYLDAAGHPTNNRGPTYIPQDRLDRIVSAADAAGFTVHIHAIGDRAVRSALDAFADARRRNGPRDSRDQIAHLELVDPADFPRFKELGVIANFQLLWAERDPYVVKATLPYLGPERSRYLYPARSLRDAGAAIAGGSDWRKASNGRLMIMERRSWSIMGCRRHCSPTLSRSWLHLMPGPRREGICRAIRRRMSACAICCCWVHPLRPGSTRYWSASTSRSSSKYFPSTWTARGTRPMISKPLFK